MSTICIDFDGVIHSYTSGWQGIDIIPDQPVPGALNAINSYLETYNVAIFSARSRDENGITAMISWMRLWGFPVDKLMFPTEKPPAIIYIDDRGFAFDGNFPDTDFIDNFKPWNKQISMPNTEVLEGYELEIRKWLDGDLVIGFDLKSESNAHSIGVVYSNAEGNAEEIARLFASAPQLRDMLKKTLLWIARQFNSDITGDPELYLEIYKLLEKIK